MPEVAMSEEGEGGALIHGWKDGPSVERAPFARGPKAKREEEKALRGKMKTLGREVNAGRRGWAHAKTQRREESIQPNREFNREDAVGGAGLPSNPQIRSPTFS
jgi:hypothetical protein